MLVFVNYVVSSYLLGYKETVQILWWCEWSPEPSRAPSCLLALVGFWLSAFLDTSKSFQSLGHFALPVSKSNFLAFPELARHPQHLPAHLNLLGYGSLHPLSPSLETYGAVDRRDQMSVFFFFSFFLTRAGVRFACK